MCSIMFLPAAILILLFVDFVLSVCIIFILNLIFVRPLSKNVYKRIKGLASDMGVCLAWQTLFSRVKIELITDNETYELLGKESAILIANHRHALDHTIVMLVNQFFGSSSNTLTLSKNSIKYYPFYGWVSWLSNRVIFLERDWKKDAMKLKTAIGVVKRSYRPWWFIVFAEGTRLTPQKLLEAQEYAISQGLHVPRNVLIPRTKGFVSIVKYSREHFHVVYDLTLVVPPGCPPLTLKNVLKGEKTTINIYIKRFLMKHLPESDEDVAMWCRERFCDKDAFLDQYMVKGISECQVSRTIHNKKHIHVR
ncbi:1-acyl-sn-glycerol-3-phosphate acyltransferase PLS1 [Artemisia annua]|uniref:1-acylglycerol-3-phosphate O-acyltransferase n=1 Tax=Artemisia annua TaxID=35608 RepID=A0A2U1PA28_ARTAN|nr:1-acyl-sn-glycerol-3-phosphate acyltransferase PLS1 [Artemisia annua]